MFISIFNYFISMKIGIQINGDWISALEGITNAVLTEILNEKR